MTSESAEKVPAMPDAEPTADNPAAARRRNSPVEHAPRWKAVLVILTGLHALLAAFSLFSPPLSGLPRGQSEFSLFIDLDYQHNFSTWWSVAQLSAATAVVVVVAVMSRAQRAGGTAAWWILAALVLLLSVDEGIGLLQWLDRLGLGPLEFNDSTVGWLIAGGTAVALILALGVFSGRHLPEESIKLIVLGLALWAFAAVGLEFAIGELRRITSDTAIVAVVYHVEEFLKLLGCAFLLVAPMAALRLRTDHGGTLVRVLGKPRE